MTAKHLLVSGAWCALAACAQIPAEAPELSAHLGGRISAMEASHRTVLASFFRERKRQVDDFIEREWLPVFAEELFKDPAVSGMWDQVARSGDPADRVKFIVILGPRVQKQINTKRVELMRPLEELEEVIATRLRADYDDMRAVNSTLTAFLQSAAKVEQNRKRYLEMVGVREAEFDQVIYDADAAVTTLLRGARSAQDRAKDAEAFKAKVDALVQKVRTGKKGG
jgi:hypothetical protein